MLPFHHSNFRIRVFGKVSFLETIIISCAPLVVAEIELCYCLTFETVLVLLPPKLIKYLHHQKHSCSLIQPITWNLADMDFCWPLEKPGKLRPQEQ